MIILVALIGTIRAQAPATLDIEIRTSAQCDKCKATIEKAMAYEKGVVKSELNVETSILKVTYKPGKTRPDLIRKAVSEAGYDADTVPANEKAYKRLPDCCKKPGDRHENHEGHEDHTH